MPVSDSVWRHQQLLEWNDTATAFASPHRVEELVRGQIAATPERVAVVAEGESLSYGELGRRAGHLAARLRRRGVGADSLVGLVAERSCEMVAALLAILEAGGGYLPLDPDDPPERLAFMLTDACPAVIVVQEKFTDRLAAWLRQAPEGKAPVQLVLKPGGDLSRPDEDPAPRPGLRGHADNLVYAIFTSGSTGRPKAAMNSHRAVANRLLWMQRHYGLGADDRVLHKTPLGFDVAGWEVFWPLTTGARLVLARPGGHLDPGYLVSRIEQQGVTTVHFVPSMLRAFLHRWDLHRCGSLRRVFASGEVLPRDLESRCFAVLAAELHNLYGPTEAAIDVSSWRCRWPPPRPDLPIPIGRPINNLRIYLVDRRLRRSDRRQPGEIVLGGTGVGRGYWQRPALTAERFVPDPFPTTARGGERLYRTGDLARYAGGGEVEFLGRLDQQVKIRGMRIELEEIESALRAEDGVEEVAVACHPRGPEAEPELVAYLVAGPGASLEAGRLRTALHGRLPSPMVPARFLVVDQLPTTPSGKLDRKALPPAGARPIEERAAALEAPRTAVEETLLELWAELFGPEGPVGQLLGCRSHFLALGGHSLLAARLAARISTTFGVDLEVRSLLEAATVEQMAVRIEAELEAGLRLALPPVTPPGAGAGDALEPSPIQQWRWRLLEGEPPQAADHVYLAAHLAGPLRAGAFARALNQVGRRQQGLRLRFETGSSPSGFRMNLDPEVRLPLPLVDLSALAPEPCQEEVLRLVQHTRRLPFDLARAPLGRALLLRLSPASHVLSLVLHALVGDEWSMGTLLRDISRFYFHRVDGCELPEPLPLELGDYLRWQRRLLAAGHLEEALTWWRQQLAGMPTMALPAETLASEAVASGVSRPCAGVAFDLAPDLAAGLFAVGRRYRSSLLTLLMAACQQLLGCWLQRDRVLLALPVAGRRGHLDAELLIGPLGQLLPVPGDLRGDPSFARLLRRVRRRLAAAGRHQEVGLPALGAEGRELPVVLELEVVRPQPTATLTISPLRLGSLASRHPLHWKMLEAASGIGGVLQYRADLFCRATAMALAGRYRALLHRIVEDPEQPLSRLSAAAWEDWQRLWESREWRQDGDLGLRLG